MKQEERLQIIKELNEICTEIGCSKMSNRCYSEPHKCNIILKIISGEKKNDEVL